MTPAFARAARSWIAEVAPGDAAMFVKRFFNVPCSTVLFRVAAPTPVRASGPAPGPTGSPWVTGSFGRSVGRVKDRSPGPLCAAAWAITSASCGGACGPAGRPPGAAARPCGAGVGPGAIGRARCATCSSARSPYWALGAVVTGRVVGRREVLGIDYGPAGAATGCGAPAIAISGPD